MDSGRLLYKGSGCAMVTPFTKENTVDCAALRKQAAFQVENGTDALIVCGTTGEASTMDAREQAEAVGMVVEAADGRVPVIAGVGGNDTARAIRTCRQARSLGADAVLAVTPYYNKTTQAGLVAHFTALAEASELPVLLYNVPSRTGLNLLPATAEELAAHENIVGLKEACGDIAQAAETIRRCGPRLPVYSGSDELTLPMLSVGGAGVVSVAANLVPRRMHRLCALYFDGDTEQARREQLALLPLISALFCEVNPIPVKTAMAWLGWCEGRLRLPLVPMRPENKARLISCLQEAGLVP